MQEVVILREAATDPGYEPVLSGDANFEGYTNILRYYNQQLREVQRTSFREGEVRFYYSGMAQALLLDRHYGRWCVVGGFTGRSPYIDWMTVTSRGGE